MNFDIRASGNWGPAQITAQWVGSTRVIHPDVERAIDAAWSLASSRKGIHVFDGPMCRLERWSASPDRLDLSLSRTSYKAFLGTNLHNAQLADQFGAEVLANPVGLSTIIQADNMLLLGRRNDFVAYYPNRIHPFAGALEPAETVDVFAEIRRELHEELSMESTDIADIKCIGLVEDRKLRQPELVFVTNSTRTYEELRSQLDRTEHQEIFAIAAGSGTARLAMNDPMMTPVAAATLELWARTDYPLLT